MKLVNIEGRKIIKALLKLGFFPERQNRGNHRIFKNSYGKIIVIPVYKKKTIKPGLLKGILNQLGLKKEEFFKLIKKT